MAPTRNMQGALYMVTAMASNSFGDALTKSVSSMMNAGQIMFLRGILTTMLVYFLARKMGALRSWSIMLQPMIMLRVIFEAFGAVAFVTALGMMPLANAVAILQALPLAVTLFAALFLKEPVGWRRWSAIILGLVGVLIIIRPGREGFTVATLLMLVSMFCTAGRDISTRFVDESIPSLMITLCTASFMTVFGATLIVPLGGWQSLTAGVTTYIAFSAVMVLIGYQTGIQAMRVGDISVVVPFRYFSLIFSALMGLIIFAEVPDFWTVSGSLIVIASGLFTFYRERVIPRVSGNTSIEGAGTRCADMGEKHRTRQAEGKVKRMRT